MSRREPVPCSVSGCSRQARSRGWCPRHYERWRRWGSPTGTPPPKPARVLPTRAEVEVEMRAAVAALEALLADR